MKYRRLTLEDKRHGGTLYSFLRGAQKKKWRAYRSKDSRGRLAGTRMIEERLLARRLVPVSVTSRATP